MRRNLDSDRKLLVEVDFANAFNTVDRQTFFDILSGTFARHLPAGSLVLSKSVTVDLR